MKRDGLESEYDKVQRRKRYERAMEFPEEQDRTDAIFRIEAAHAGFRERMAALDEQETRREAEARARATEHTMRANKLALIDEYRRAGLDLKECGPLTPDGTPMLSLSFMLAIGWKIEEVDGRRALVAPPPAPSPVKRKSREEHAAESLKEGF
jgi:hypothetical protein